LSDVVLRATNDLDLFGFLTRPTLSLIESHGEYDNAVIYAILHEAIYCQGYETRPRHNSTNLLTLRIAKLHDGLLTGCVQPTVVFKSTAMSPKYILPERW
jgi:hypothetical protein